MLASWSSALPESATGWSRSRSGTAERVGSYRPHQRYGWADGTSGLALVVGERGQPGQPVGRLVAQGVGGIRVDGGGAQLGDERGDGEGAAGAAGDVARFDAELGEEAGRLVAVVGGGLDRGDDRRSRARVAAT